MDMFALRLCPNRDIGFSPFQLMYGKHVRTPLDAMYAGWAEQVIEEVNVCDWVDWLRN